MAFPTNNCDPRIALVDESCGCTLSRASIHAMTPADIEAQGFMEVGMASIIANKKMARMTGVRENTLADILFSSMVPIKRQPLTGDGSIISPFILIPQKNFVNSNYWEITAGSAGAGQTWVITVKNNQSQYATSLVALENYFLPGKFITVLLKDAATHVGRTLQFKVISAVNANGGGIEKAAITVDPPFTAQGWANLTGAQKAVYQPTHGGVVNLGNSVSDFESSCYQYPAENTAKLLTFWPQTLRRSFCYNDEMLRALNAQYTSEWFKKFRQIPLVDQQRRITAQNERDEMNTIFFGQKINEMQTTATYTSLPQVIDTAVEGCVLEYKANTEGIHTLLSNCGRVIDMQGAALDFDVVKALLNPLKRHREMNSGSIDRIDIITDRFTRANVFTMMISYYKLKYGLETTRFYQADQKLKFDNIADSGDMSYDLFDFPDEQVSIAVYSHTYFDDHIAALPAADRDRGRALWILDLSDIRVGLGGAASVERRTNTADNLYNCQIKINVKHYTLSSKTITVLIENPSGHSIIENFSTACPTITANTCVAAT